jgi:ubiquinone/menaquinone biosynthesis C-methylase UbiE
VREDVGAHLGRVAVRYGRSRFLADPSHLDEVLVLARPRPSDVVLDAATGAGHTALELAPYVRSCVGLDITREMLAQARREADARHLDNLGWALGDACRLPFPDETFDLHTVRAASHHFYDLSASLAEAARVLKPGGRACVIDSSPPQEAREVLHPVEIVRDPSHVRSWTMDEWAALLTAAGLDVELAERRELECDFEAWMEPMGVPPERRAELAARIERSDGPAREQLRPRRVMGRLHHSYWNAVIRARKPR